jgi:hypothetical protein
MSTPSPMYLATKPTHGLCDGLLIGGDNFSQIFRVHTRGKRRRTDKVREHHGDLAALGAIFARGALGTGRGRHVSGGRVAALVGAQFSDSFQQHPAVTDRTNADFLQVLLRETREDSLVYLVLAECGLVLFEAQAP